MKQRREASEEGFNTTTISAIPADEEEDFIAFGYEDDSNLSISILRDLKHEDFKEESEKSGKLTYRSRRAQEPQKQGLKLDNTHQGSGVFGLKSGIMNIKNRYDRTLSKKRNDSLETVKLSKKFLKQKSGSRKRAKIHSRKKHETKHLLKGKKRDSSLKEVINRYENNALSSKKKTNLAREVIAQKPKKEEQSIIKSLTEK